MLRFIVSAIFACLFVSGTAFSQILNNNIPSVRRDAPRHKTTPKPMPKPTPRPVQAPQKKEATAPKQTKIKKAPPARKAAAPKVKQKMHRRVPAKKHVPAKKTGQKRTIEQTKIKKEVIVEEITSPAQKETTNANQAAMMPPVSDRNDASEIADRESNYSQEEKDYHSIDGCDCMKYSRGPRPWKFRNRRKYEYKYYIKRMYRNHGRHH